jgi:hypothetical protein
MEQFRNPKYNEIPIVLPCAMERLSVPRQEKMKRMMRGAYSMDKGN